MDEWLKWCTRIGYTKDFHVDFENLNSFILARKVCLYQNLEAAYLYQRSKSTSLSVSKAE